MRQKFVIVAFSILFLSKNSFAQTSPKIFINEFLSSNLSTNPDMVDFDGFSDWIELYNDESIDVNIGGYYLTDNFSLPTKWQFPPNTIIPAKGFSLVWADGYNDIPGHSYIRNWWPNNIPFTTQWYHTNFKLDRDGEQIGLFNSSGALIDSVSFVNQVTDVSYGRKSDGSASWFYLGEPTPLNSNVTEGIDSVAVSGNVIFSIEGGFYPSAVQVTLSSSAGSGVIRYTIDGSKPTSSSIQYTSPLTINSGTILRARLFESSKLPGKIFTNSYFINEPKNLPVISIVTDNAFLWDRKLGIYVNSYKEREIPISMEFFPSNSGRAFQADAGVRIGGENIFRFAQKPLNIYARGDYGFAHIPYKIFEDLPFQEYKQLYLRNSGSDWTYTMFRDGLFVTLLKNKITNAMQDYRPAALYLNGKYWGINNIREKIIDEYFLQHYHVDPADLDHIEDTYEVISGDSTDFVSLMTYANNNDLSIQSKYDSVASQIDVHDLMDFVIAQDYIANISWGHNREMWRDRRTQRRWRWVLVDMDRGFDSAPTLNTWTDNYFPLNNFTFFTRLLANTNFKNEFLQRYAYHLNHTFANSRVVAVIDSIKSLIEAEMPRHIQKWGTLIDSLSIDGGFGKYPGITSMTSWNSEVQRLKNFSALRAQYAVQYLNSKFGLSGRASLTITSNVQNTGKVFINGFLENAGESNLYFKNVPLPVKAYPPPGYVFKQWKEIVFPASSRVVSSEDSINYTVTDSTELIAEFDPVGSSTLPGAISSSLTLTKANSPYYALNNVTIESGGSVTVERGTVIYFSSGASFYVKGKLSLNGTKAEPITLTSYYPFEKWGAVCMDSGSTAELKHVNISNSTQGNDPVNYFAGVSAYKATVLLNNVRFNNVKSPVSSQWSSMVIDSCVFENVTEAGDYVNCNGGHLEIGYSVFKGNALLDMDAVDLGFMVDTTRIHHNVIQDFSGSNSDGIDIGDASKNVIIDSNSILRCYDKGVSVGQGSQVFVSHTSIAESNLGVGVKDSLSYVDILNCTFYANNIGVESFEKNLNRGGGSADVRNSIFANSKVSPFTVDALSTITINYSLSNTTSLPGIGNILGEPLMINPKGANFHLQTGSPGIDNGDPASPKDIDGTQSDIGAMMYAGVSGPDIVINEINYNSSADFNSGDWIELYNNSGKAIDLSGWVFMDEKRAPSYVLSNGSVLQPNAYVVICNDIGLFDSKFPGVANRVGNSSSGLSGSGEALFLYDISGRLVDSLTYRDKAPWPAKADGGGSSLELENPSFDNSLATNWAASIGHGTPGTQNSMYVTDTQQQRANLTPTVFALKQNYPNPFNPSTTILFDIPVQSYVSLKVYDIVGREVATLVDEVKQAGEYSVTFDGSKYSSGIYFYWMETNTGFVQTKKLVLLR